jgi:hypothetical protein
MSAPRWTANDGEISTCVEVLGREISVRVIPTETGPSHKCLARLPSGRKLAARSPARLGLAAAKREAVALAVALAALDTMEQA